MKQILLPGGAAAGEVGDVGDIPLHDCNGIQIIICIKLIFVYIYIEIIIL